MSWFHSPRPEESTTLDNDEADSSLGCFFVICCYAAPYVVQAFKGVTGAAMSTKDGENSPSSWKGSAGTFALFRVDNFTAYHRRASKVLALSSQGR
jgi:hypothetical protein